MSVQCCVAGATEKLRPRLTEQIGKAVVCSAFVCKLTTIPSVMHAGATRDLLYNANSLEMMASLEYHGRGRKNVLYDAFKCSDRSIIETAGAHAAAANQVGIATGTARMPLFMSCQDERLLSLSVRWYGTAAAAAAVLGLLLLPEKNGVAVRR